MTNAISALRKSEKLYATLTKWTAVATATIFALSFVPIKFVWVSTEYLEDGNDVWYPSWSFWKDIEFQSENDCIASAITCESRMVAIRNVAPITWITTALLIAVGLGIVLWVMTRNSRLAAEAKK